MRIALHASASCTRARRQDVARRYLEAFLDAKPEFEPPSRSVRSSRALKLDVDLSNDDN